MSSHTRSAGRRSGGDAPASPEIRVAKPDDADTVRDILLEAAEWLERRGIPLWVPGELDEAALREHVEEGRYAIAFMDGEGAGTVRLDRDDPLFWPDLEDDCSVFVHRLAVRRRHAGGRVSHALLDWAVDRARGLGSAYVRLDCESDRQKLRDLYEAFGFSWHSDRQVGPFHATRYVYALDPGVAP